MEEKLNIMCVGFGILVLALITSTLTLLIQLANVRRQLSDLKVEMEKGDAALHERANMMNKDIGNLYTEMDGIDGDLGRVITTSKLNGASIKAVDKRLRSLENVTNKMIAEKKEAEEKKNQKTTKARTNTEEVHEVYAESSGVGEYLGVYELTAYEYTGSPCANGNMPNAGYTVACNSLPLGTRIYIEGYGYYVVEDRGGMAGNVIDVYLGDPGACIQFGRRTANVYLAN